MSKTSYTVFILSLLNDLIYFKTKLLISKIINQRNDLFKYYRNILTIIANTERLSLAKTITLVETYLRSIDHIREYYSREEANYILEHKVFIKALNDTINILEVQGALSIYSRILFLIASLNHLITYKPDLSRYLLRLNNLLTLPVPPHADDAKIIDFVKPGEEIIFVPGSIYTLWALEILIEKLLSRDYYIKLLICNNDFELCISKNNVMRYWKHLISKDKIKIEFIDCNNIASLFKHNTTVIINKLVIYHILDNINRLTKTLNPILVFNPSYTVLQKILGHTPIVISVTSLRDILFRRYSMEKTRGVT